MYCGCRLNVLVFQLSLEKPSYKPGAVCFPCPLSLWSTPQSSGEKEAWLSAPPEMCCCWLHLLSRAPWTHLFPSLLSVTSRGWLNTSCGGSVHTMQIIESYNAGLPAPHPHPHPHTSKRALLPAQECPPHPMHQENQTLYFLSAKLCLLLDIEMLQGTKPPLNISRRKTKVCSDQKLS